MTPGQIIAAGVALACVFAAGALVAAVAYRAGQRDARTHRTARERRRRSWLAAKVWELRTEVQIRQEWCRDILAERDELLKERARLHPEHN